MSLYVLDTSALLTYIEDEEGASEVESLLIAATERKHILFFSIVTLIEVFYVSLREQGATVANERLKLLSSLPMSEEGIESGMVTTIGRLKAACHISFADACIAGLALYKKAILVHKDPEFKKLSELTQHKLAYKKPSTR